MLANEECFQVFQAIDAMDKIRFVIYKIDDSPEIVPEFVGTERVSIYEYPEKDVAYWQDFVENLPEDDCRFIAYNFVYQLKNEVVCRTAFILWIPESASRELKMIYTANTNFLMMYGERFDYKATDFSCLTYDLVVKDL